MRRHGDTAATGAAKVDLEELVAEADTGGRKPAGIAAGHLSRSRSPGRCSSSGTPRRCRSCSASASSTTPRRAAFHLSFALFLPSRPIRPSASSPRDRVPLVRLGARAASAIVCGALSGRVLPRARAAARPADRRRHCRRGRRRRAADRGHAARRRARGCRSSRSSCWPTCSLGPYLPGRDGAQGRLARPRRLALLAHVRRRVRRRARRLDQLHLPVRAVRRAAGEGRRRQLLHPGRLLAARPLPRRPGQGRRGRRPA